MLIIFVKSPIPGDVKTRFLPHFNSQESADLYICFVKDILAKTVKIPDLNLIVAYQPHTKLPDLSWTGLKRPPEFFKQEGKSLGERLTHAFGVAFGRGARHVVIIGSDAPALDPATIDQAFRSLEQADLVMGPSSDGGYYLIGLSRASLRLFEEVSWSTDQVFERTAKIAEAQGYTLRVLPPYYDIDTLEDLWRLADDLTKKPALAPQTEKFLNQLIKNKALLANS